MGTPTNSRSPLPGAQVRARKRVRSALSRKRLHVGGCAARTTNIVNRLRCCSKVSDKLEALKNLIPSHTGEASKPDQLFKETANYIVLLRTQVVILQKLIDFYGSSEKQNS